VTFSGFTRRHHHPLPPHPPHGHPPHPFPHFGSFSFQFIRPYEEEGLAQIDYEGEEEDEDTEVEDEGMDEEEENNQRESMQNGHLNGCCDDCSCGNCCGDVDGDNGSCASSNSGKSHNLSQSPNYAVGQNEFVLKQIAKERGEAASPVLVPKNVPRITDIPRMNGKGRMGKCSGGKGGGNP